MRYPDFYVKGPTPCSQIDPENFFPEPGAPDYRSKVKKAKEACGGCQYLEECLAWALENNEEGVWGNTTDHERRRKKRDLAVSAARARRSLYE
jgi:WhiB family transcriptional regulator, redox-sensing transcriptional regulator